MTRKRPRLEENTTNTTSRKKLFICIFLGHLFCSSHTTNKEEGESFVWHAHIHGRIKLESNRSVQCCGIELLAAHAASWLELLEYQSRSEWNHSCSDHCLILSLLTCWPTSFLRVRTGFLSHAALFTVGTWSKVSLNGQTTITTPNKDAPFEKELNKCLTDIYMCTVPSFHVPSGAEFPGLFLFLRQALLLPCPRPALCTQGEFMSSSLHTKWGKRKSVPSLLPAGRLTAACWGGGGFSTFCGFSAMLR